MRQVIRGAIVVVLATLLAALATPIAQAADPQVVQRFTFDNELDPELSAQFSGACGFRVEARVTGKIAVITRTTNSGTTSIIQPQSYVATYTNTVTGESLTLRSAIQYAETIAVEPGMRTMRILFRGLNFLIQEKDGSTTSAGRRDLLVEVTLDNQGNVINATVSIVSNTPNLAGLASVLCPRLVA